MGLKNLPTRDHSTNLRSTALGMEQVRKVCGDLPVTITSGYRSPTLNERVGGVPTSDHAQGFAADFYINTLKIYDVAKHIAGSDIAFDQLIYEPSRGIVHISFNPKLRNQVMTQERGPGSPFVEGIRDV